jgi:hypothetical protein
VKKNDRYGVWRFRRVGHYWCRAGKTLTSNSGSVSPCCMCMYPPPHMVCACILLLIYSYIKLWFCLFLPALSSGHSLARARALSLSLSLLRARALSLYMHECLPPLPPSCAQTSSRPVSISLSLSVCLSLSHCCSDSLTRARTRARPRLLPPSLARSLAQALSCARSLQDKHVCDVYSIHYMHALHIYIHIYTSSLKSYPFAQGFRHRRAIDTRGSAHARDQPRLGMRIRQQLGRYSKLQLHHTLDVIALNTV